MNPVYVMSIAVAVVVIGAAQSEALAAPYKCKTNDGRIEFSDMPCSSGFRQEGNRWIDVEAERKQKHLEERLRREARARQDKKNDSSSFATNRPGHSVATAQDINKLTTYAVILGRAISCGADVGSASQRVGRWMDRVFPPGSTDQKTYLPIFMEGTRYHAEQQKLGKGPDSCSSVLRTFSSFPGPSSRRAKSLLRRMECIRRYTNRTCNEL